MFKQAKIDAPNLSNQAFYLGGRFSRERRDTLLLLAVLFFILIPHFFYLPIWATVITVLTLLWRAWISRDDTRKLPHGVFLFIIMLSLLGITLLHYRSILGPEAGGCLLVMLVALKTLELKAKRDAMVIFYLGFFLIMMSFFQSQSILMAAVLLLGLVGLLMAVVNANIPSGIPSLLDCAKVAIRLLLWGAPLMLTLFLLFPRLDPLWGLPDSTLPKTGVSDELSINSISSLAEDRAIAFRVKFSDEAPKTQKMYFRGPVLTDFDGEKWTVAKTRGRLLSLVDSDTVRANGHQAIKYEVTLESNNRPWLFTLDFTPLPPETQGQTPFTDSSYQWQVSEPLMSRMQYKASAYIDAHPYQQLSERMLRGATRLPTHSNPKTQAWAEQLMQDPAFANLTVNDKVQWLLNHIQKNEFYYTLTPPSGYLPEQAADQLWFDFKSGFCEHYASAFTILMRAMDIPARIVTGYQGAEPNYIDNYWIVRQSNAHAWVEVWDEATGWMRVDPTHAIDPSRILYVANDLDESNLGGFAGLGVLDKILMRWDALENAWNQWVLAYNVGKSLNLLEKFGFKSPDWKTLLQVIASLFALVTFIVYAYTRWKKSQEDVWWSTYTMLLEKMKRAGFVFAPNISPRTAASMLKKPEQKQIKKIFLQLEKIRYATAQPYDDTKALKKLKKTIQQLKIKINS